MAVLAGNTVGETTKAALSARSSGAGSRWKRGTQSLWRAASRGTLVRASPGRFQRDLLATGVVRRPGRRVEWLFARGELPSGLFAVLEGGVRITASAPNGKEVLLALVAPPMWFGEISVFDGLPRTHDAVAAEKSVVLHVRGRARSPPRARAALLASTSGSSSRASWAHVPAMEDSAVCPGRSARAAPADVVERYGEWHDRSSRVVDLRQQQLATMLSTSRQTVRPPAEGPRGAGIVRLSYRRDRDPRHRGTAPRRGFTHRARAAPFESPSGVDDRLERGVGAGARRPGCAKETGKRRAMVEDDRSTSHPQPTSARSARRCGACSRPGGAGGFRGKAGDPKAHVWGGAKAILAYPASRVWLDLAAERGWTAPTWPREYGGGGLEKPEARSSRPRSRGSELPPPLVGFGLTMIGPTLLQIRQRGLEAASTCRDHPRRDSLVPGLLRARLRLRPRASLQTRAVLAGDDFIVTGQKIWTSYADRADWMFLLVRTDPAARKQEGITFLLMDMSSPGVR